MTINRPNKILEDEFTGKYRGVKSHKTLHANIIETYVRVAASVQNGDVKMREAERQQLPLALSLSLNSESEDSAQISPEDVRSISVSFVIAPNNDKVVCKSLLDSEEDAPVRVQSELSIDLHKENDIPFHTLKQLSPHSIIEACIAFGDPHPTIISMPYYISGTGNMLQGGLDIFAVSQMQVFNICDIEDYDGSSNSIGLKACMCGDQNDEKGVTIDFNEIRWITQSFTFSSSLYAYRSDGAGKYDLHTRTRMKLSTGEDIREVDFYAAPEPSEIVNRINPRSEIMVDMCMQDLRIISGGFISEYSADPVDRGIILDANAAYHRDCIFQRIPMKEFKSQVSKSKLI